MARSSRPKLTSEIVEDEEALTLAIDAFIKENPELLRHRRLIARLHRDLRRLLRDDHYREVLHLDDAHVDLAADLAHEVTRWAFAAGIRTAKRSGGRRG